MAAESSLTGVLEMFLRQLVGSLPTLLVYLGGIILTLLLWRRQPRASLLVLLGLGLMLTVSLRGSCLFSWVIYTERAHTRQGTLLTVLNLGRGLLHAVGLCLVLAAVFVGRSRPLQANRGPYQAPPLAPEQPAGPSSHVTAARPAAP